MSKKGRPKKPNDTPDIPELRNEINRVDGEILERLARRRELSQSVARAKDIQEVLTLQGRYAQTQMQAYALQAQEIARLMTDAAQAMQPKS